MLCSPSGAFQGGIEIIQPLLSAWPAAVLPAVPVQAIAPFPVGLRDPKSECPVAPHVLWGRGANPGAAAAPMPWAKGDTVLKRNSCAMLEVPEVCLHSCGQHPPVSSAISPTLLVVSSRGWSPFSHCVLCPPRGDSGWPGAVGVHTPSAQPGSEAGRQPPQWPCSDKEAASRHRLGKQLKHKTRQWKNQKGKRAPQLYPPLIPGRFGERNFFRSLSSSPA